MLRRGPSQIARTEAVEEAPEAKITWERGFKDAWETYLVVVEDVQARLCKDVFLRCP